MRKELLGIFIITALIVSLTFTSVSVTSLASPVVSVDPQTTTVKIGATFEINVTVANVTDSPYLYGWQFNVTWNPTILSCISVREGTFIKDVWNYTQSLGPGITSSSAFAGSAIIADAQGNFPQYGASGSGTLATVTFEALSEGQTALTFVETKLNTWDHMWDLPKKIDHTSKNGTVTVTSAHDVAVVDITAPIEAASPSSIPIDVRVKNEGSFSEEANVTVYYNETYIDSRNVTLNAGASQTVSFTWNTTVAAGNYIINATATIPVDDDPADNYKTKTIELVEHDVAVTDVDAPPWERVGANVTIDVTVEDQGAYAENLTLTVYYNETYIDSRNVTLNAGASQTVSFTWNTTVAAGNYIINATATIPVDDDPADNYKTKTIELKLLHDVAVISLEAPDYAHPGDMVPINVTVKNEGDFLEEINITIRYHGIYIDSKNVTLASGNSTTASFNWNTTSLTAGPYTISASATIPVDDDPGDNYNFTLTILQVHDVAVISIPTPPNGYAGYSVDITVTVKNEGDFIETVNVTLKYDTILIGNKTVNLVTGQSLNVPFTWDLTDVTPGTYTLNATATIPVDDDPADNTLDDITVFITIAGDANGDGTVDNPDLIALSEAYGSEPEDSNWNRGCDFNNDGIVDASDVFALSKNYGKSI